MRNLRIRNHVLIVVLFVVLSTLVVGCDPAGGSSTNGNENTGTTGSTERSKASGKSIFTDVTLAAGIDFVGTNGAVGQWRNRTHAGTHTHR